MNVGPHPSCKCCAHDDVDAINDKIRRGIPLAEVAKEYRLTASSLWRHRKSHVGSVATPDGRRTKSLRKFNGIINGVDVAYTYLAGDSSALIAATDIATAINSNGSVNTAVKAVASGNGFTLSSINGKSFTLATNPTGGATLSATSELDFVSPNVIYPLSTFAWATDTGLLTFEMSSPREVDNATRTAMKLAGLVA